MSYVLSQIKFFQSRLHDGVLDSAEDEFNIFCVWQSRKKPFPFPASMQKTTIKMESTEIYLLHMWSVSI